MFASVYYCCNTVYKYLYIIPLFSSVLRGVELEYLMFNSFLPVGYSVAVAPAEPGDLAETRVADLSIARRARTSSAAEMLDKAAVWLFVNIAANRQGSWFLFFCVLLLRQCVTRVES